VPARLRRGLPERAMRKHEENSEACASCHELVDSLLSGGYASKLRLVTPTNPHAWQDARRTCRSLDA
jgi:hypothetical protein